MKGCLRWLGALMLVGVVACAFLAGLGLFVIPDALSWRCSGVDAMLAAGVITFVAGRSRRFATMLYALSDPAGALDGEHHEEGLMGPAAVDDDYRAVAGVHPAPGIVGVLMMVAALVLGASLVFP
jgi:hypothetical protein